MPFLCECAARECEELVLLTLAEFAEARERLASGQRALTRIGERVGRKPDQRRARGFVVNLAMRLMSGLVDGLDAA